MRKSLAVVFTTTACLFVVAPAKAGLHAHYRHLYHRVAHRFGPRAPGRNIAKLGVVRHDSTVRRAHLHELAVSIRTLKRILHPPVYTFVRKVGPPPVPPSGSLTAQLAPSGLASCIVSRESGGNPTASNGTHFGIGQWTYEAWSRMGGTRYSASPLGASYQQQLQILSSGLQHFGCRDWCPYDGC